MSDADKYAIFSQVWGAASFACSDKIKQGFCLAMALAFLAARLLS